MPIPTLNGITAKTITSDRIKSRVLFAGDESGIPVIFVHGNLSSATYWEEIMLALPEGYYGIALDQRGYGDADPEKYIDATRGLADLSDDILALMDSLNIEKAHVAGHSMGGAVLWQLMMDAPDRLLSVTLAAPGSPFGFGGTKDAKGTWSAPDSAGSGGGIVNPVFVQLMKDNDRSEGEQTPRVVMNSFYWKPPFKPEREEELLSSMLSAHLGDKDYPGDSVASEHYPNAAPGKWGVANALAPIYQPDINKLYAIDPKPPVLWIRGDSDQIVSDMSLFDFGTLGKLGAIPDYPGEDVFPPQPMVSQTRYALDKYQQAGGTYSEVVFEDTAHSPFIEKPDEFNKHFHIILKAN